MLDLVDPWVGDGAGQRDERGAGLAGGAELAEPRRAVARDQRDVGERLDVVDQRRAAADTLFEGHRRRERGLGGAAAEVVDERRLLPGDVVAGHRRQAQGAASARRRRGPFLDRARHAPDAGVGRLAHAHDQLIRADGLARRGSAPSSTRCGSDSQQRAVLQARRLALGGVGHDDRAAARAGDGAHLGGRGERRAAAPEQARALDLLDQHVACSRARRRPRPRRAGQRTVHVEVLARACSGAARADPAEQPRQRGSRRRRRRLALGSALGDRRMAEPLIAGSRSSRCSCGSARAARWACPSDAPIPSPAGPRAATARGTARSRPRPPSAAPRQRDRSGPADEHARRAPPPRTSARQTTLSDQQPGALDVAAGAEAVQQRDRPARVRQPVDRAPGREAHPRAQQARDDHRQQQVEGDRAEPQPERAGRSRRTG